MLLCSRTRSTKATTGLQVSADTNATYLAAHHLTIAGGVEHLRSVKNSVEVGDDVAQQQQQQQQQLDYSRIAMEVRESHPAPDGTVSW